MNFGTTNEPTRQLQVRGRGQVVLWVWPGYGANLVCVLCTCTVCMYM